jgi:hypothetical protein
MSNPLDHLPPLAYESGLSKQGKLRRERELMALSIKRAELKLKEIDKRLKGITDDQ